MKLQEEIAQAKVELAGRPPLTGGCGKIYSAHEVYAVMHGRTKVVPRELFRSSSFQGDEGRFFILKR